METACDDTAAMRRCKERNNYPGLFLIYGNQTYKNGDPIFNSTKEIGTSKGLCPDHLPTVITRTARVIIPAPWTTRKFERWVVLFEQEVSWVGVGRARATENAIFGAVDSSLQFLLLLFLAPHTFHTS